MGGGANPHRRSSITGLRSMILNEQDSGRTIDMKVGNVVTVRLKENRRNRCGGYTRVPVSQHTRWLVRTSHEELARMGE